MDFLTLAKNRYSSRKYLEKKIEPKKLDYILEAARIAPSAVNKQPWYFVVITEEPMLQKIKESYRKDWLKTAPAIIIACSDHEQVWKRRSDGKDHADIDIAIAVDHITLAATEQGLATCWICYFDPKQISELLNLPKNIEPAVMLPVGYPADKTDPDRHDTKRKNKEEIIRWQKF